MLSKHQNNFDLLRLVAAFQVLLVHASEHLKLPFNPVFHTILNWFPGVSVFFVISGYLIAGSFSNSKSLADYARNRVIRIWPALWVSTLISAILLYYFGQMSGSWSSIFTWFVGSSTFAPHTPAFLRAWGTGSVNGSLWTIPVELQFYIVLPFLFRWVSSSKLRQILLFILLLVSGVSYLWLRSNYPQTVVGRLAMYALPSWLYLFFVGVLLRLHRSWVERWLVGRVVYWLAFYLIAVLLSQIIGFDVAGNSATPLTTIPLALLVVSAAYSCRGVSTKLLRGNDISYGVYIYHMILINVLVHVGLVGQVSYLLVAVLGALLAGAVSWLLVEKPMLKFKAT